MPHSCEVTTYGRPAHDQPWKAFVCGWSAALISVLITYPMGKLIFRQMLHGIGSKKALHQLHSEGIGYLYRGILPPMIQRTGSISIMFSVYEEIRKSLLAQGLDPFMAQLLASSISGVTESVLTPFERVMTLLSHQKHHKGFKNTADTFRQLRREHGFLEYYRGFVPVLMRNGPATVIFFVSKEQMQRHLAKLDKPTTEFWNTVHQFLSGAAVGGFMSTLYFPLNVVKVRIQSKIGGEFENVFRVMAEVYNKRGRKIRNMYKGVATNFFKAMVSWGTMNAAYEFIWDMLFPCKPD